MQSLSAAEAIGPALERTKVVLFRQRDWRLFLKLSAVAALAGLGSGFNMNLNVPGNTHSTNPAAAAIMAAALAAVFFFALIGLVLFLVLVYTGSRMQLVLIDVVVLRETRIAPLWRKYGAKTWRWIGLKFVLFLGFMVAFGVVMVPFLISMVKQGKTNPGITPPIGSMLGMILGIFVLVVIFFAVAYQVRGFVLPVMALEDSPAGEGFRRLKLIWRHEPGAMLLFLLMRFILGIAFGIAALIVMGIGVLVVALPVGGLGWALWHTLAGNGVGMKVVLGAAAIVVGLFVLAWVLLLYVIVGGFVSMFFQAYSLYFYGGRYPLLGDLLEPPGQSWWNPGYGMMTPPDFPPPGR